MLQKHLVIVGSGWAGMRLARELKNIPKGTLRVTLLSDINTFRYSAALYRVATGRREREAIIPISEIIEDLPNVTYVRGKASTIDRAKKIIITDTGKTIHYDYAVLALGMVTTYFDIPGLQQRSYSIKTARELRQFRTHLHQELLEEQLPDKNYIIVGAGPTGVELAAALTSYMKSVIRKHGIKRRRINVEIVEAASHVLPGSTRAVSDKTYARLRQLGIRVILHKKVESETSDALIVDGKAIPTHTVIWTAGVTNNPFFKNNMEQFTLNEHGKVVVDNWLRVDDSVYVIGDNAATPYSGLGLTAVHNGKFVSHDIIRRLRGKPTPAYKPLVPATVVPVGARWAVFHYRGIVVTGWLGAILRSFADLTAYNDIVGWKKAITIWLKTDEREEMCVVCKSALEQNLQGHPFAPNRGE